MRSLILSALILASAFQIAVGQTYTSGDYQYTLSNGQATITGYTGAGGAVSIPSALFSSMPNPVPYTVVSIGSSAFNGCTGLTSMNIPNSVTSIGSSAFSGCTGLTSMNIPNSVTSIGSNAFYSCSSLTSIVIPNSVTSIGSYAFYYCSSLTSIVIPNSVTSIGSGAFESCVSLGFVSIPNSVTSIGGFAFFGCTSLTSIVIPNSVTSIVSNAFSNSGLGSVFLPSTLASQIGPASFPSTAVFYVGSVGLPTSMASQADLATTQAQLATTQAQLAMTQAELATTKSQITTAINEGKASGIASVTASPNTWSLFTTSQIQNMAVGDLVLTRTNGSNLVLNYDIEQSEDLQTWTTYQAYALPLTNLPTNKAFVRIKAKQ
jgi:hypothetical protein